MKFKLNPKISANRATIYSFYAAIIGLILTAIFSYITYGLADTANDIAAKSLQLSESDTLQNLQLTKLSELAVTQARLVNIQIDQLAEIREEVKLLRAQLETTTKHYNLASKSEAGTQKAGKIRILKAISDFDQLESIGSTDTASLKSLADYQRPWFLSDLKAMLLKNIGEPFLTTQSGLHRQWEEMVVKCNSMTDLIKNFNSDDPKLIENINKEYHAFIDIFEKFRQNNLNLLTIQ